MVNSVIMNKAVFLDRDGTIIEKKTGEYITGIKNVRIYHDSAKAIRLLNKEFLVIIITNQPQVAKGLCTEEDVKKINSYIINKLRKDGAKIDSVFYCPHHLDKDKYGIKCKCRKPEIQMVLKAKNKFGINLPKSYFVGDTTTDIKTGKNSGCKTILLKTGDGGTDNRYSVKPDFVCDNLLSAAKKILKDS